MTRSILAGVLASLLVLLGRPADSRAQDSPGGAKMMVVDDFEGTSPQSGGGTAGDKRLELKYELKEGGVTREVLPDHEFETGQKMFVSLRPATDGNLYVVYYNQGAAENYFPHPQLYEGRSEVWKGRLTRLPLEFAGEPGKFTLIAVLVERDAPEESRRDLFRNDGIDADQVVRLAGLQLGGKGAVVAPQELVEYRARPGLTVVRIPINHAR